MIPLSRKLKILRIARNLQQVELAEMTGIDQTLISRYERGYEPTPENLAAIEKALGFSFNDEQAEQAYRTLVLPQAA